MIVRQFPPEQRHAYDRPVDQLRFCALNDMRLTRVPETLINLRSAVSISLADNDLETVPAFLAQLPCLRWLDLSHNARLRWLPAQLLAGGKVNIVAHACPMLTADEMAVANAAPPPVPSLQARCLTALARAAGVPADVLRYVPTDDAQQRLCAACKQPFHGAPTVRMRAVERHGQRCVYRYEMCREHFRSHHDYAVWLFCRRPAEQRAALR